MKVFWRRGRVIVPVVLIAVGLVGGSAVYYVNRSLDRLVLDLANSVAPTVAKTKPSHQVQAKPQAIAPDSSTSNQSPTAASKQIEPQKGKPQPVPKPQKVDNSDKAVVIRMVTSKLPGGAVDELKQLARGGATPENIARAKVILKAHLSAQDIEELRRIARKYKVR